MATETAELTLGSVTVEDAGTACKKITIEIPADAVNERLETSLQTLMSSATLPGFRAGRVPRKLLERRFGEGLRDETKTELLRDAYTKAIEDEGLKPLGDPIIKDHEEIKLEPGKPLTFSVEIEIFPDFELPKLESIELTRPMLEATSEVIDTELEAQCRRRGEFVDLDGSATPGDFFMGPTTIRDEKDEEVATAAEAVVRMPDPKEDDGKGTIAGLQIAGLAKLLGDKRPGDEIVIQTTGPDQHEIEAIRDKKISIHFTINRLVKLVPATVEEICESFGLETEQELREQMELAINSRIEWEQQDLLRRQAIDYLVEHVDMDLPERASAAQTARTLEKTRLSLLSQGVPSFTIEEKMAELRSASQERALKDLKAQFILQRLAEDFEIEVNDAEVNSRVARIARSQNVRPEKLRSELAQSGRLTFLAMQIRHEKATDCLVERAKITEMSAQDWNEKVQAERENADDTSSSPDAGRG